MRMQCSTAEYCFNSRAREGRDRADRGVEILHGVSIHAPARGATHRDAQAASRPPRFNSRAREGRDASRVAAVCRHECFNSRAREGRDWPRQRLPRESGPFQFTRPRGARPLAARKDGRSHDCFNSRAREGRDQFTRRGRSKETVSIHAPARGATAHIVSHYSTGPPLPISANILRSEHLGF